MGNSPLKALKKYYKNSTQLKNFKLKNDIGCVITDNEPWIYPLYHTALRARRTRKAEQQKKDWLKIKEILRKRLSFPKSA